MVDEKRLKTINDHQKHYDKFVLLKDVQIVVFQDHLQLVKVVQSIFERKINIKLFIKIKSLLCHHLVPLPTIFDKENEMFPLSGDHE